ncbi:melanoma inhibitory activity protein 2 isoform X2 [Pantherophis guttatus]|uniref:Melanoma inhibitory activity protein 2 n=1 Tax=Pantherophis guttatus TaxID=94885 RepID=A0A6P9C2L4_PANGU|nr:melanoma inhibitory activity protein 2 isoform X2 [Pantherophis guttatus]
MLKILDISLTLLILSLSTNTKSTKVLSAQKKCGDSECETTMSRVLAIKDYTGPDCRYLSFKNGEEIMVYFKLSREREDLWAGSKGKDFGYFPMDAVQTEEAFVTEEIEVPTKETDFLCLDGEEYVFENEDSIFNRPAEENEHDVSLYTDGKDSDFNMSEDEIMKLPDTSIPKEYSSHSKTDQDDSSQQEDPIGQALNPVPTQSIWTVFGITGWLGLGGEEHKEAFGKSSEISEQITFRHRKIAIADNADIQEQPKESKMEPRSWFQSSLTDLLHFGNEKSGHDPLYKDGDLDLHSSSNTASNSGHHGRTAASKARIEKHSDNELSESNWFGLKLNDILTFGYAQKDKEQPANGKIDQNEDPLPSNIKLVPVEDGLREAAVEQMLYEEQSKYVKKNIEQTLESVVDEEKEKYHEEMTSPDITDPEVPLGNECPDFMNTEAAAFSTELAENLKSSSTEQDSISGNQINENTPNSERTKSQSDSVIHSEIQYSEAEELQCISSFSHYKDLFSFQNFPDKTINSLQEIKRTKVKNSQSKNSVESLQKNKELEKKNMLHQKTANLKEISFNKEIFLLSSTMQNNAGSTNVTKEARLLSETIFPSSEKHFSEYIIEPLFQDKKTCDKNFDKPHKTSELQLSLQRSTKQYKYVKRVSSSRKQYINKFKHLNLKGLDESTPVICYTDVMKKTEISEPLVCLYSQKYDIQEDVIVSHKENEFVEVKNVASMLPGTMKFFPLLLQNKSITKEIMNQFSQKRAKVEINVPKQILQLTIDTQQESKRMQTTEKYPNNLKQQRLSPFITGQELLPCEKEFYGLVKHNLNFVTYSMEKKYFQDPQMQIGERSNEVNSSERIEDYYDSAQSCDVSSVPKTIENYAPQEQTISHYPDSHTFSKKSMHLLHMYESLIYSKEGKKELKSEQKILASHVDQSDREKSIITGIRPDRKHINQVEYTTKTYLTPNLENEEFKILTQRKKKDGILNIGDTEPEFQQETVPLMSSVPVVSQKKTKRSLNIDYNNLLLKKHGLIDTFASEDLVQRLDIQREDSKSDLSINPSKFSSDELSNHLESINHIMDRTPRYTKGNLNTHHLVVDPDNEMFTQDKTVCFKNLNYVDKLFIYGHEKVKPEKGQEDKKSEKNILHRNKNGRNVGQSVISNIFDKTAYYFGKIFKKTNDNDFTKHKINKKFKAERHKAKHAHEQTNYECQDVNAFCYFNKVMQWKKSVTADSENDNRNTDRLQILERESVFQNAIQNCKLITNKGLDWKDASSSLRVQEFTLKLAEESRKIFQANICVDELQQLEQEFEKLQYNISISPCEYIYKKRKQATTSVEHQHKLNIGHGKCMKTKMHLLPEIQGLIWDSRNNCGSQKTESDNGKLPGNGLKEKNHLNSNNEAKNDQYSEKNTPSTNCKKKPNASGKKYLDQQDIKEVQENNLMNQSCIISNENERLLQIILDLNTFCAIITSIFSSMIPIGKKVVSSLPENMKPGPDLFGFSWEIVMVAIFTVLLFLCRMYKSVKSRLYLEREKQLASKIAELIEERCKLMEKLSLHKKEYAELENTLKDGSFLQESTIASNIKIEYEKLNGSNSALKNEIEHLEKELKEEKSKQSEQDNLMADIQKRKASLENEAKSIQFQVAEAKTTLKVHEINRERLKTSLQDAIEENRHLHESEKQLLQEAEGWNERFNELNEQIKMYELSQANLEEALKNKESQMKSLTDCLLRMKDWSCATGEHDSMGDNHKDNDIKNETENEQHLDIPEKETVKKLIYAAKLNAHLKSAETERNQIYSKLGDEKKAKEELAERIERLQKEHVILQSENIEVQNEIQKLQQKLQVMTELYQENEMNLHRKLTVEEKERLQKEEKLSKVDEKINHAAEELNTYRHRVKDLEEELERTVCSYEKQINSHEKKAHDNWLTARAAERQLNDMRKENLHRRQNLTEIEFKHHLLKKDPYAYDDTATAFGRGSRGLGNPGITEVGNERGELNTSRLSDPHRPPSDTGSLSPPWDRDHRVILPHPGHLYNEQSLPFRRPERFYPNPVNSGRLSGPAELRSYNMHSVDKTDEPSSENNSRMDLSGDELRDHSNDSNIYHIHDQSLPPDNETLGPGIVPPPLPFLRAPLMSMDPRGSFMRRGPPFPPVPPGSVYGSQEYFPRDFAGLPRPLLPMRAPFPMRPFSQYPPPPRAGFFPPPPPPPPLSDNRNEVSAELTQLSTVSSTDNQESQQETG